MNFDVQKVINSRQLSKEKDSPTAGLLSKLEKRAFNASPSIQYVNPCFQV